MKKLPAINEMKEIPVYSLDELKGLLKLAETEGEEWFNFKIKVIKRINRLEVKYANKKRQICANCNKAMQTYVPDEGKFKGQAQTNSWTCSCNPGVIISIG